MATYVSSNAELTCSWGDSSSKLAVLPDRMVLLEGENMANIMDNKPMMNIQPFGQCQSLMNPVVAAATAANYGILRSMPCIPNTVAPWTPGEPLVSVAGHPALMDNCRLTCIYGGMIQITDHGQSGKEPQGVNSRGHEYGEFEEKIFGKLSEIKLGL